MSEIERKLKPTGSPFQRQQHIHNIGANKIGKASHVHNNSRPMHDVHVCVCIYTTLYKRKKKEKNSFFGIQKLPPIDPQHHIKYSKIEKDVATPLKR